MAWFKVDDRFWGHPKVAALARSRWYHEAISLWTSSGSWAGSALTDGVVPREMLVVFRAKPRAAEALCKVGLWEHHEAGYRFVDWADYQPSSEAVRQTRKKTRERTKRWRDRLRDGVTEPVTNGVSAPSPILNPILEELRSEGGAAVSALAPPARAPASPREAPSQVLQLPTWTADRQSIAFRKAYLARRQTDPSMYGKQVGDFHRRVLETARARGRDPAEMFDDALRRWLDRELNERERSAPYACFANAFGDLVDDGDHAGPTAELKVMQQQVAEALRIVNAERHNGR